MKEDKIKQELKEIETININLDHRVTKLIAENEHLKQTYKQLYDSINHYEKVLVITALKENLRKLKGKVVVDEAVILHPIDPELLKINVAPLAPKLRNNRTAHYDYLKHTQEETATLREIVEHEKSLNPLNTSPDYACVQTPSITVSEVQASRRRVPNIVEPEIRTIEEVVTMADRTMKELLQAPTEGYGEAIVILEILADNFEIKTNLLQLVQTNKFHGFERDNPHTHISNFKRMTSTLKYRDVPNNVIKLMLFPYSLERAARIWYEKEPPNSILTWDDLDSLNVAAGGNLLSKTTREALKIIENKSKVRYSRSKSNFSRVNTNSRDSASKTDDRIDKLADQISNLVEIVNKQVITPAYAKAVEKTCVICGGAHAYYDCIATDINQPSVCAATGFQNQPFQVPNNQIQPGIPNELSSYMKSNEILIKSMQNQINVLRGDFNKQAENLKRNLNNDIRSILGSFFQNQASTLGTLSSNIVPNPKGEMKAVTTRSGLAYEGPPIPTNSPLENVVERDTEETTDKEHSNCQGSTAHIQPLVVPISISEPDVSRTQPKPNIPYPSRLNDQKLREKATNQMEKFF
nr:hypothetical protein [Tanacetum cinerariifolium]